MGISVRAAGPGDADAVLAGVLALLRELSGDQSRELIPGSREAALAVIGDRALGTVLIAIDTGTGTGTGPLAGMLGASCQTALRAGGEYLLIQELYVAPAHRRARVGNQLIEHLASDAAQRGLTLIEVGLPGSASDPASGTRRFYLDQGFTEVGPRMRLTVAGKEAN